MVEMKEGGSVLVIPRQPVVAVSPGAAYLSPAMGVPTPSPFSFSVASTRWSSSRPSIHYFTLFLRAMVLFFSFGSSLALAATMTNHNDLQNHKPEFIYSIVITTMIFIYSLYQLFKGIWDIAFRGVLISEKTSDYTSFIIDLLSGYLLVSCSSVIALAIHQQNKGNTSRNASLNKAAIISVCMSVAAFFATAVCAVLSGYKLSKRIMW